MRILLAFLIAFPLYSQCRLPAVAPDAVSRMSAWQLVESGHFLQAVQVLEPVVQQNPKNGEALWLLSRAKSFLGDMDEALKLADQALATDETNAAYHVQAAAVAGRMAQKASLLKQLGLARRVKKELDDAAKLDPRNTDAQYGLMMFYFAAPSLLGGDKAKTQQIGEEMSRTTPDLGFYYQGRLAHETKDTAKEESFYQQSVVANPLLYDASQGLTELYLEKHELAKAQLWACQAIHIDATRGQGWSALARILGLAGCWTEAAGAATAYEATNPADLSPWYAIASAALERGEQMGLAEEYLRKYVSRPAEGNAPSLAMGHWQLGLVLERKGNRAAAISEIQMAVQLDAGLEGAKNDLKRLNAKH